MHLAALIDLGVPVDHLQTQLARLNLADKFSLELKPAEKMGINGLNAQVHAQDEHDHRHHDTIQNMIRAAAFDPGVEQRALAIFQAIANALG